MNILKEKFSVGFTEASDSLNAKQKCDTIILNDEPMRKKNKETDLFDNQSDNECFVDIESEQDDESFLIIIFILFLSFVLLVLFIKLSIFFLFCSYQ